MKRNRFFVLQALAAILPITLSGCAGSGGSVKPSQTKTPNEGSVEAATSPGKAENGKDMLLLIGHASVRIITADGTVIYIDPSYDGDYSKPADMVLMTHGHGDHNDIAKVAKNKGCTIIAWSDALKDGKYQSFDVNGIKIRSVPAYNKNHKKSECVGFVLEFDGIKLYHAGDTSKIDEMADLASENLDYALLPMDGFYNMGPAEAMECAAMIKAKHYIPIHTGRDGVYSQENIDKFKVDGKIAMKYGEEIELVKE